MNESSQRTDDRLKAPPEDPLLAVLQPALKVGSACGAAGFCFGGAAGIVKGTAPVLFATASGVQTFILGTSYWGCRSVVLQAWTTADHPKPSDLVKASTISGGLTGGAVAALTRGRSNALPGAVMFSLFGCLGQMAYNRISAKSEVDVEPTKGFWRRMSEKSFSPVSVLTNDEYAEMLREKMLKVDVEIAIIDDKIAALRQQELQKVETISNSTESEK